MVDARMQTFETSVEVEVEVKVEVGKKAMMAMPVTRMKEGRNESHLTTTVRNGMKEEILLGYEEMGWAKDRRKRPHGVPNGLPPEVRRGPGHPAVGTRGRTDAAGERASCDADMKVDAGTESGIGTDWLRSPGRPPLGESLGSSSRRQESVKHKRSVLRVGRGGQDVEMERSTIEQAVTVDTIELGNN